MYILFDKNINLIFNEPLVSLFPVLITIFTNKFDLDRKDILLKIKAVKN